MAKKNEKQEDNFNYSFLFKCMAALTAAAIITAGIIAAVALKSTSLATAAVGAKMMLASTVFIFPPLIPIAMIAIGLVCVLPFLFGCNGNTHTTIRTTNPANTSYGSNRYNHYNSSSYEPSYFSSNQHGHANTGTVYIPNNEVHSHSSTQGNTHGHDNSHVHGHSSGSNMHGHH
ncbi:MAG: hypothetical protein HYX60_02835 [Legionella longbeachae]|nr:hypothetical protein [Legionella longbeachae]